MLGDWPPLKRLAIVELGEAVVLEGCGEAPLLAGDIPLEGSEGDWMREELCSQAGDLLQLWPISFMESLELGVWLTPPELSPSLGSRNKPRSASCWLARRTFQTVCCSVLVLNDTAKLEVLEVNTRRLVSSRHSVSLPPCLLTTRVKSSRG